MEEGMKYTVSVEGYDMNGFGIARIENKVVFIEGAMKEENVVCEITHVHKKYAFAKTVKVLTASVNRIPSCCPYSEQCGGCDLLHMNYWTECEIKENRVKESLKGRIGVKFNPIISSTSVLGYRNKVMVPFARDENEVVFGFYEKNSHKIIPMKQCPISSEPANRILYLVERYLTLFHISVYDEATHSGIFKEVMIRHTALKEYMVVLVVAQKICLDGLVELLVAEVKEIKSIFMNINFEKTNVVLSDHYELLYGSNVILEDILGLKFEVSPASFMQVNHSQCERLYSEALRMADLNKHMTVIDAYCGMGSITLNIAKYARKVYGIEVVEAAIRNANRNKERNHISNAEFICGKCEEEITKLANREQIDVIFFDPPRKGCDIRFLKTIMDMKIAKIIYISCNIATAARDIAVLEQGGYILKEATPVDLFSRTSHVESICSLVLKTETK